MSTTRPIKKKAVSGSIDPRWPKPKVVRWLEIGAIPAILGLWLPDWLGAYTGSGQTVLPFSVPAFPPLLTYVGAIILLVGCYQGIKDMGFHFRAVLVSGGIALASAVGSIAAQLLGRPLLSLLFTGLAAVFGVGFLWFTIGKVAEITQETRARVVWYAIGAVTALTAGLYLTGLYLFATAAGGVATSAAGLGIGSGVGAVFMRSGIVALTLDFALCRYGVHCYKTQTSIGAGFRDAPDEQYWTAA